MANDDNTITITQTRSTIGQPGTQGKIIQALGLKGIGKKVVKTDNNCIRGMVNKVRHLVSVEVPEGDMLEKTKLTNDIAEKNAGGDIAEKNSDGELAEKSGNDDEIIEKN